jgi:hypothetical protein
MRSVPHVLRRLAISAAFAAACSSCATQGTLVKRYVSVPEAIDRKLTGVSVSVEFDFVLEEPRILAIFDSRCR